MGVGDLSVGKKMRKLGEAIYGRVKGYDAALDDPERATALGALIGRTVFADADPAAARPARPATSRSPPTRWNCNACPTSWKAG